jgi:hypothetical protein
MLAAIARGTGSPLALTILKTVRGIAGAFVKNEQRSSFCGKRKSEVRQVIAIAGRAEPSICDECVTSCVHVLKQEEDIDMPETVRQRLDRLETWARPRLDYLSRQDRKDLNRHEQTEYDLLLKLFPN